MSLSFVRSRIRRAVPILATIAAALLSASCGTDTTGTDTPGFAALQVQPQFAAAMFAPVTLDRVEALVERVTRDSSGEGETRETLLSTSRAFRADDDELSLTLRVPIKGNQETVRLTLSYFAGPTLLFVGSSDIDVTSGRSTSSEPLGMTYVGPGSSAVGLIIEPFDTTVTAGSLTSFRATAIDGQENDVGAFYMRWSVSSAANGASIDAAGRLRAPSQSGTIWVRGNLPNGVDDSVQVTVTGTPGGIRIVSGDHQTGQPGSPLELPLAVEVTTSGGAPVSGVTVTWTATVGGGSFEVSSTVTDDEGLSQNSAELGQNPGVNEFTATVAGVGSVTFIANEGQTGNTISWLGNTNDVWSNPANWNGGIVPSFLDSVVIGSGGEFNPVLDTTPVIGALTLNGSASLIINNHGLGIVRNLTVLGDATINMTQSSDAISVGGNALFDGGDSRGFLSAGGISIAGNFTQRATNSGQSFSATGDHLVSMVGAAPTVSFATPGTGNNQSSFHNFYWPGTGTLTLSTNVVAGGTLLAAFSGGNTITSSNGSNLQAGQLLTGNQQRLIFNNVSVTLQDTVAANFSIGLVTFQNMPTNRAQLTLNFTGGIINLNQFVFSTTPVAPNGVYLDATDSQVGDGSSLSVQVQNPTPGTMGSFFREGGDAEIIWPYVAP
jgi:hypothetical protein